MIDRGRSRVSGGDAPVPQHGLLGAAPWAVLLLCGLGAATPSVPWTRGPLPASSSAQPDSQVPDREAPEGAAQDEPAAGASDGARPEQERPDPAPVPAEETTGPDSQAAPSLAAPAFTPTYRGLDDASALLAALAQSTPEVAHTFELGRTRDGRPVVGIEFGAVGAPGLAERPTVFLFGGLDGQSLAGGEAVLAAVHGMLAAPERLPAGVAVVAVPWVAAEALSWTRAADGVHPALDGRSAEPVDDDGDGRVDEDGPDDLDGDGMVLDMLIEDPSGPWARGGDGRFLVPAAPGEGVRFLWTREGRDDDGDGRFNEDPLGGVVLDRNFPVNRRGPWQDPCAGVLPLSEPLARALADLVLSRRAAVVVLFQGHHGMLAVPGGLAPEEGGLVDVASDRPLFERVTEAFRAATGRSQAELVTLRAARGAPAPGAALDWLHAVSGALAIEVAPWGPRVEEREVNARDAGFQQGPGSELGAPRSLEGRALLGRTESEWARWLDNTRGGLGFVDWQPVELDGGRQGWVGGWEPRTILNPPEDSLATALEGLPEFALELASSLPQLAIEVTHLERDAELLLLRARVHNQGRLPTGLERAGGGVRLELDLPAGARLVAGSTSNRLPRLFGGELSREESWVLVTPLDSTVTLTAHADWSESALREVRR